MFRVSAETGRIERYILVACREEDAIEIYSVDKDTGMPVDTGRRIPAKAPVCVRWIK